MAKLGKRQVVAQVEAVTSASPFAGGKKSSLIRFNTHVQGGTGPEAAVSVPVGTEPPLHSFVILESIGAATTGKKAKWKIVARGIDPSKYAQS
ncbi:hypothetical protein KY325_04735 [Candidatus Woesearchaeota archaeon]|nr:hypothetical protein [Candidatus Woesearchaeota archaeon]MBW3018440.1 hypothetical protein [Candidatus Woesearchaeota archaeon]